MSSFLRIHEVFRYGRPYDGTQEKIDGQRNHFFTTNFPGLPMVLLEKGINQIADVKVNGEKRRPAIIIRSSPNKIGSETTPWQDIFDVDNGHIRYYGDNKIPGNDPALAPGNKILLEAFDTYNDPRKRMYSTPLIFYKAVTFKKKQKGFIEFNGFGIIKSVELITQYDRKLNRTFSNYAFNFQVFSLAADKEQFDWKWINYRRDKSLSLSETEIAAPKSWTDWIKKGSSVLERNRRRVSKLLTYSRDEQLPTKGSREEKVLNEIYKFYSNKKARFEGLASIVAAKILGAAVGYYKEGWITPASSDGGADFYGRVEIGQGFGKTKLIVLGQAKCESISSPTGGNHIGRTVARLRRGWIGVYITTSYFSESVQREIIEDEYPIMLVNGKKLADTVLDIIHDDGFLDLTTFLNVVDYRYDSLVATRRPDELLFE